MNLSTLKQISETAEKAAGTSSMVDWQSDTTIPASWTASFTPPAPRSKENPTVVLTGATGYLDHHLLLRLVEDMGINQVI
jgi:hypothetical protein